MNNRAASLRLLGKILLSRPGMRLALLLLSFLGTTLGLLAPYFQKEFIDGILGHPIGLDHLSPTILLLLTFISMLLSMTLIQLVNYLGAREAVLMQGRLSQELYNKTLELRTDSLMARPIGEIVSLYTVDVPGSTILLEQSLPQGMGIIFPIVLTPYAIHLMYDIPLWPLILVMSGVGLLSFVLALRQSRFFIRFKQLAADRIGLVSEWVQNMRTLRILSWLPWFEERIFKVRRLETENRIAMLNNGQTMNAVNSSATFMLNIVAIVSFVYLSNEKISTGALLSLLWIVAVFMTRPFRMMPWFFTFVFDSWTSMTRVAAFMSLTNKEIQIRQDNFVKLKDLKIGTPALTVNDLDLKIGNHHILKHISFSVQEGEFVAIVGEVGSGKSLLLLSLLGETGASFGEYSIGENNAISLPLAQLRQFYTYVPQEGFLMSASLRQNIAIEYTMDNSRDQRIGQALTNCEFDWTKERLQSGLETEIGERGVNLSGGQKQRLSLARVDFFEAPIVLLDDCISAVDVDTEQRLIDNLLCDRWKDRTRLLVTHRLSVLKHVDKIIFLEDGKISGKGTLPELLRTNKSFQEYTVTLNG